MSRINQVSYLWEQQIKRIVISLDNMGVINIDLRRRESHHYREANKTNREEEHDLLTVQGLILPEIFCKITYLSLE